MSVQEVSKRQPDDGSQGGLTREMFAAEAARVRSAYSRRPEQYLYSFFRPSQLLLIQERERKLLSLLGRLGLASLQDMRILEIGCGTGMWLREFVRWGASPSNIWGVDLLPDRIAKARELCPPAFTLESDDAASLRAPDGGLDLVLQSTVFSSLLNPKVKQQVAREMLRVLRPGGAIIWYDFHVNNPRNPDVRGVGKKEIFSLFPGCRIVLEKLTLAPPVGRPVARLSVPLYRLLSSIKPLCTHYLGLIIKS